MAGPSSKVDVLSNESVAGRFSGGANKQAESRDKHTFRIDCHAFVLDP